LFLHDNDNGSWHNNYSYFNTYTHDQLYYDYHFHAGSYNQSNYNHANYDTHSAHTEKRL
jgi:hypothetical protein